MRRDFLDRALVAGTILMAVATLAIIVSTIRLVQQSSQSFTGNLTFYASQVEYDVMQLIDRIDRYSDMEPGVDENEVMLRFDILWSRVHVENPSGRLNDEPLGLPKARDLLAQTKKLLVEVEPFVMQLDRNDPAGILDLKTRLRSIVPVAHALALAAKDDNAQSRTAFLKSQLRQTYFTFAFITGTVIFGILSIMLLRIERREIQVMNAKLEDRVRARTEALEASNRRLAAEVEERERNKVISAEREARLAQAAQLAKLGYYVWDAVADRCEFCSEQHAQAHGVTPQEYIDRAAKLSGEFTLTYPDDREMMRQKYRELRAGNLIEMEYRVDTPSGVRRLREVARPIFDDAGRVIKEIGTTLDITEQHETELQLAEAQRMDSIGKLTGGIAHDFNNLLAVILGNLELLKEIDEQDIRAEMIGDAIKATLRGRDLTLNMLSFARRAPLALAELNLNTVVSGMEGLIRRTLPENISLNVSLDADLWPVVADQSLTESALLNLVINARDAMPEGGSLTVEAHNFPVREDRLQQPGDEIEIGDYVMLAVTDTGTGMAAGVLSKIFDPFFTTKPVALNSGLGLSMVHGFMKQTGGTVRVYSEPGVGTTFKLFFKAAEAAPAARAAEPPVEIGMPDRCVRVLLVEDDNTVRKVLSAQLRKSGYSVVAAAESAAAERAFKTQGPFDLMVSDIVMPGDLQGPALARHLRQNQPDLPVVFLSGYPQEATLHGRGLEARDIMLMKPVSRIELLAAIDAALRQDSAGEAGHADAGQAGVDPA